MIKACLIIITILLSIITTHHITSYTESINSKICVGDFDNNLYGNITKCKKGDIIKIDARSWPRMQLLCDFNKTIHRVRTPPPKQRFFQSPDDTGDFGNGIREYHICSYVGFVRDRTPLDPQ